jgi:hypothetical protein
MLASVATTRLIDQISGEMAAQKNVLEGLATIRRRFLRLRELTGAVPHDDRIPPRIHGDLVAASPHQQARCGLG